MTAWIVLIIIALIFLGIGVALWPSCKAAAAWHDENDNEM